MNSILRLATVFATTLVLTACAVAPQTPVQLNANSLKSDDRIGVAMTALPKVELALPGAGCLLCQLAAFAANSSLNTHTKTLSHEDLPQLKDQLAQALTKKGKTATVILEPLEMSSLSDFPNKGPNIAIKDFTKLKAKYGVEKLLIVDITAMGIERTYSSYFPTSPPRAYLVGSAFLVNLSNNTYEWFSPVREVRAADGNWDEPPKFPGLTNAYFQLLESTKDEWLKPFND
jgi:hypothetical protein